MVTGGDGCGCPQWFPIAHGAPKHHPFLHFYNPLCFFAPDTSPVPPRDVLRVKGNQTSTALPLSLRTMEQTVFTATLPAFTHTDETLVTHAKEGGEKIEEVDLVGAAKVTDVGVQAVAQHCPNVVRVNLCGCNLVGDAGVVALAERCIKLEALLLSGVLISDSALVALGAHAPALHDLDLSCCRAAEDPALPNLLVMEGLPGLSRVTDAGLTALADGCPGLISVSLAFCSHITGAGVSRLARTCNNLVSVNLGDLPAVGEVRGCVCVRVCMSVVCVCVCVCVHEVA